MTSPDPAETLRQINVAREQSYQNIALTQAQLTLATQAADATAKDRAAIQAIAQQTVSVDTSVGTRVYAGDTVIHSDTGWRNITSMLTEGWSGGRLLVRRIGDIVLIEGYGLMASGLNTSTSVVNPLPAGFASSGRHPVAALVADLWVYSRVITSIFQLEYRTPRPDIARDVNGQYRTSDPWPASLPGTPA